MSNQVLLIFLLFIVKFSFCESNTKSVKNSNQEMAKERNETIEEFSFELDCSIRALAVENESKIWFAGNNNLVGLTKNNGKDWSTFTIKYDTLNLEFRSIALTKKFVFVLSVASPALLFKIDKESLEYEMVYKEEGEKVFYDSMQFWDDKNGIAIGDPTENCMSILMTYDGGNTWKKLSCQDLPKAAIGEAAFAASNSNISLINDKAFLVTGGKEANVLVGEDFGKKWTKYSTPIVQGDEMTGIFSCNFFDENIGIIAGGNWQDKESKTQAMATTKNGGKTWEIMNENPGYISCIQFVPNSTNLLACSTLGVFFSTDFGKSWNKISSDSFYNFRFSKTGKRVYFSGKNILKSVAFEDLLEKK